MRVISTEDAELRRLYDEVAPKLWRALFGYAQDRDVASDATAEAFAQYIRRREHVRSPAAWIWRAAFRIAAGELKRRRTLEYELPDTIQGLPDAATILVALRGLTPRQRAVTVLRYYGGHEPVEIARIIGTSASTVRVHLLRARRRLEALLEDRDDA